MIGTVTSLVQDGMVHIWVNDPHSSVIHLRQINYDAAKDRELLTFKNLNDLTEFRDSLNEYLKSYEDKSTGRRISVNP